MLSWKQEGQVNYKMGFCLSSDTKPTGVANGSCLLEMDTGTLYYYDAEGEEWVEFA